MVVPGRRFLQCLLLGILGFVSAAHAQMKIVLGGNQTTVMGNALTSLGRSYTLASGTMIVDPTTYGLGRGDLIILSNDGGSP